MGTKAADLRRPYQAHSIDKETMRAVSMNMPHDGRYNTGESTIENREIAMKRPTGLAIKLLMMSLSRSQADSGKAPDEPAVLPYLNFAEPSHITKRDGSLSLNWLVCLTCEVRSHERWKREQAKTLKLVRSEINDTYLAGREWS